MFSKVSILLVWFFFTEFIECITDIKTSTACEGQTMNLECPVGDVIFVKFANYGRTNGHTCLHPSMDNRNCYASSSLNVASHKCNNKQKCSIDATNAVFGDPCSGTHKYLTVQYECLPVALCAAEEFQCNDGKCIPESAVADGFRDCSSGEDEEGKDYKTAYACEDQTLNLYCKQDEIISIINANYGRLSSKICSNWHMSNKNCKAATSLKVVKDRCNEKGFCSILSTNQVFGDPCYGTHKYLEVHYECVRKPTCTQFEFQCVHGHCIDDTLRCDGKWDCATGEDEARCPYLTEIACENSNLSIQCKKNQVIQIIGANYGRQEHHICTYQARLNCLAPVSKKKLVDRCAGKRSCNIIASNTEFGDPCVGTVKYLSVNYKCVTSDENVLTPNAV